MLTPSLTARLTQHMAALCAVSAVAYREKNLFTWLMRSIQQHAPHVPTAQHHPHALWVGNPNAPYVIAAHIDEVGGVITRKIRENTYAIEGVGWVYPPMLAGQSVEITHANKTYAGIITYDTPVQVAEVTQWQHLTLRTLHPNISFPIGTPFRYLPIWKESDSHILGTSLDNRLGTAQLLEYIFSRAKIIDFNKICFVFTATEEAKNEGALWFFEKYKPKKAILVDMIPHSLLTPKAAMDRPWILKKTNDYTLAKYWSQFLKDEIFCEFSALSSTNALLENSEAKKLSDISGAETINFFTPLYNYHHGAYLMEKAALQASTRMLYAILDSV